MNILVLSPVIPFPTDSGSKIRIYESLLRLSERHTVTLIGLYPRADLTDETASGLDFLKRIVPVKHNTSKLGAIIKWVFSGFPYRYVKMQNSNFRKSVERELAQRKYDAIILHCLESTQNLPSIKDPSIIYVLDQHNNDITWYKSFSNSGSTIKRMFSNENVRRQRIRNQIDYEQIDLCLCASKSDLNDTRAQIGTNSIALQHIPNGVDFSKFHRTNRKYKKNLIFCGSLDVEMNIDAITYFIREIFPLITNEVPEVTLTVVGRNPSKKVQAACQHSNIRLHSNVDSVVPFYNEAKIMVLPFRHGGGSKLKVMEAIAMEVDIISTAVGLVGIATEVTSHLSISEDTAGFAAKTIEKLKADFNDPIERNRLASLKYMCIDDYSWSAQNQQVESLLNQIRATRKGITS